MGLDWIVQAKRENGRMVEPGETTGERPAAKSDPETLAMLQEYFEDRRRNSPDPGPKPVMLPGRGGIGGFLDAVTGTSRRQRRDYEIDADRWTIQKEQFEHWRLPFDQLVEEHLSEAPPILPPENRDALGKFTGALGGFYEFRGDWLGENVNDVTSYAAENLKMDFIELLNQDRTPDEVQELADDLERALSAYRASGEFQEHESVEVVEEAILWLRFWAMKGHSIVADV